MQDNGSTTDHWELFEDAQEQAQDRVAVAEAQYQELVAVVGGLPDAYATALTTASEEVEQLDDILDVSAADAERARALADRVDILADILSAKSAFHRGLLEAELSIYERWYDQLPEETPIARSEIGDAVSSLWSFVHQENHGELRSNSEPSLGELRRQLYEGDQSARDTLPEDEYVSYCLEGANSFTERFTDDLKHLVRNEVPIRIKTDRKLVTEALDTARDDVEHGEIDPVTVQLARDGFEGTMMLTYQVAYADNARDYCRALVDLFQEVEAIDEELEPSINERDVRQLEALATTVVADEATVPIEERVVHLLKENDRNVTKALQASDVDNEEFFEAMRIVFQNGEITDIKVHFE